MWLLGFWQDFRDAAQAADLLAKAYASIDAALGERKKQQDKATELEERNQELEEEVTRLKSRLRRKKTKKKIRYK